MNRLLRYLVTEPPSIYLYSLLTGLYVSAFYVFNNLTMLNGEGIILVVLVMTVPMLVLTALVYFPLRLAGLDNLARAVALFIRFSALLFFLRPSIIEIGFVTDILTSLSADGPLAVAMLLVFVPAALVTLLFRKHDPIFGVMIATMLFAVFLMNFPKALDDTFDRREPSRFTDIKLRDTPNIYFILADGLGSVAYMKEKGINVSSLEQFLESRQFTTYSDTFSNYQPTTSAMSAILDMDHHFYSLSGWDVDFSEVSRTARAVIGGENNLVRILRRNGYEIQYNHGGTYLLLQGCSADVCLPEPDKLAGARLILSHVLDMDLLSESDKIWSTISEEKLLDNTRELMASSQPRFQYVHNYEPGHAPNRHLGKCDEHAELLTYGARVAATGLYLERQVRVIIESDPNAVIVVAGDHGPFIANRCNWYVHIDSPSEYRDRAGSFIAIRWPNGYQGDYDHRIKTGVNLFRYVLASLSDNSEKVLNSVVPDDVYTRAGEQVFKVMEDGEFLTEPVEYIRERDGNRFTRSARSVACDDPGRGSTISQGLCFYNNGEMRSALYIFQKALKNNPEDAVAWNNVCATLNQLKKYDQAVNACRTALSIAPDHELARNNLKWAESQLAAE